MSTRHPPAFELSLYAVPHLPLLTGGEDIAELIVDRCTVAGFSIADGDVVVIAQKIVSKAEHRLIPLASFEPSPAARELAAQSGHDPRACEAYLQESDAVVAIGRPTRHGLMLMMRHRLGFVAHNAGIDRSNATSSREPHLLLLPTDPDDSARRIRSGIRSRCGRDVAVIINDSCPKLDRLGTVGEAIGFAGISAIEKRVQHDLFGTPTTPLIALVDELSAAASIVMGQADEGRPVVIVRGASYTRSDDSRLRDLLYDQPPTMVRR